jgi:eukaryotic-like serine/threonine-protein kinase
VDSSPKGARDIFLAAIRLPAEEQEAYLREACGDDQELHRRVSLLLRAQAEIGSFHAPPDHTIDQPATESPGTVIGPYKLIEPIGEGGMGTVWMAQQTEPVKRLVAVKLIKAGMDSEQVIARLEAERQALALMDHPNIARVLDGGTTEQGRPYFVMDLVRGVPITKYCDEHHLTPRQRLELFVPVCQAVQHAHQKGIIHRDLKPSNVLVALYDGKPVPKVIDFGVAKAAGQSLTDKTLVTGFGNIVGTLEYMSPEQAEINQLDIDTRSDIYSLGVLLYELLTGSTPLTHKRMKETAYAEILRLIKEEEPPRPSTRLSDSGEALASISANRHTEPAKLSELMRGELDWIVMKTLEKDRNRRYETANGFAMDVQRYLADEAVLACPPTVGYRLRKFARRNKPGMVMASVVGVAILLAVGSLGWVVRDRQAGRVRTAAEVGQFLERAESLYAGNKLPEAMAEVEKARGVLEAGRGNEELGRRVRQWATDLDTAAKLEEIRLESYEIGEYGNLEEYDRGYADYARVFRDYGIDVDALSAEEVTARVAASKVKLDLVLALGSWASQLRSDLRPQDPARWQWLLAIALAADSDPWRSRLQTAVEAKDVPTLRDLANGTDPSRMRTRTLAFLGDSLRAAGEIEAAVAFLRRAQQHHPGDFSINSTLAVCLSQVKPPPQEEVLAFRRVALAVRPQSALAHQVLGDALHSKGLVDDAIAAYRESIRLNPDNYRAYVNLGFMLSEKTKFDEAIAAHREAIRLKPDGPGAHYNLGFSLVEKGRLDEAIAAYRECIRLKPDFPGAHSQLSRALRHKGLLDEAIAEDREEIRLRPGDSESHWGLGLTLADKGLWQEAVAAYREAVRLNGNHAAVHHALAVVLATCPETKVRDGGQAVVHGKKAVALKSGNVLYWQTLGWAYYRAGDCQASIEALEKSCKMQGDTGDHGQWIVLAMAHAKLALQESLPVMEREHHEAEARRLFEQADKKIDSRWRVRPGYSIGRAIWDFRAEARVMMGTNDPKK